MDDLENKDSNSTQIIIVPSYVHNSPVKIMFIRLSITIVSALIMFTGISEGTSFFRSLFIFCSSILFSSIGMCGFGWKQKLHNLVHVILYMYIMLAALGLFDLLQIMVIDGNAYMHFNPTGPMPLVHIQTKVLFYILVFSITLLTCIQYMNTYESDVRNIEKEEAK